MPVIGGPHLDLAGYLQRADASLFTAPLVPHGGEPETQSAVQVGAQPTTSITYNNGLYTPSTETPTQVVPTLSMITIVTIATPSTKDLETVSSDSTLTSDDDPISSLATSTLASSSSSDSSIVTSSSSSRLSSTSASPSVAALSTTAKHGWSMTYNLIIAGSVVLLVGLIGVIYTRRRLKRRKNQKLAEEYLNRRLPLGWQDEDGDDTKDMSEHRQSRIDAEDAGVAGLLGQSRYAQPETGYQQYYDNQYSSSTSATDFGRNDERGWGWGAINNGNQIQTRRNVTPPSNGHQRVDSEDLNAYLAESRTGYTPAEAEEAFSHQRQPSFSDRLYSAMTQAPSTNRDERKTGSPPHYGFSTVNPLHVANPDLPRAPSSIQRTDTQISRSVKRWQLSDGPAAPPSPSTPKSNRYQDLVPRSHQRNAMQTPERASPSKANESAPQNRLPSSLQAARKPKADSNSAASTPLSPPAHPALFFASPSRSPGCPMPAASQESDSEQTWSSIAGIASLVYPSYPSAEGVPSPAKSRDAYTTLPSSKSGQSLRDNTMTSPLSETSHYSEDVMTSPQHTAHRTIRKAITDRRRGAYRTMTDFESPENSPEKANGTLIVRSASQDSLEQLLRQVR